MIGRSIRLGELVVSENAYFRRSVPYSTLYVSFQFCVHLATARYYMCSSIQVRYVIPFSVRMLYVLALVIKF